MNIKNIKNLFFFFITEIKKKLKLHTIAMLQCWDKNNETKDLTQLCCNFTVLIVNFHLNSKSYTKTNFGVSSHSIDPKLMHRGLVYYYSIFEGKINLK